MINFLVLLFDFSSYFPDNRKHYFAQTLDYSKFCSQIHHHKLHHLAPFVN